MIGVLLPREQNSNHLKTQGAWCWTWYTTECGVPRPSLVPTCAQHRVPSPTRVSVPWWGAYLRTEPRSETGQIHDLGWFLLPVLGVVEMRSKGGVWSVLGPLMVYSWLFWPFWAKWEKSPEIGLFCPSGSFFSGRLTLIFTCFFISFLGFWWSRDL